MKNKINHLWTLACKGSSEDRETNLISLFELFDEFIIDIQLEKDVEALNLPTQFQIVTLWEKSVGNNEETADIALEYYDPSNKKLGEFNYKLTIPQNKKKFRQKININGLGVTKTGTYIFKVNKREKDFKEPQYVGGFTMDIKLNKKIKQIKVNNPPSI